MGRRQSSRKAAKATVPVTGVYRVILVVEYAIIKESLGRNVGMANSYYKPCKELDECNELIQKYFETQQYEKCFQGHLRLAEQGYPLAECQVGYFYFEGLGVEKDFDKAYFWTERAAVHGDRDAQCNLADLFYLEGIVVEKNFDIAKDWLVKAALQDNDYAIERCAALGIEINS